MKDLTISRSVHDLNDDCLLHIFEFIDLCHRIDLELVCRRWQRVCSWLWKATRKFDVTDVRLGYKRQLKKEGNDINVEVGRQVFSRCFSYLTEINLSRSTVNFEGGKVMNSGHDCCNDIFFFKCDNNFVSLESSLLTCENIEKLYLCCCVLQVDDEFLIQLFKKNQKLRSIVLARYRLTRECLSYVPLDVLESFELYECHIMDECEPSFAFNTASKLHTLSVVNRCFSGFNFTLKIAPAASSKLIRLNLLNVEILEQSPSDICNLKNLTYLSLRECDVDDGQLSLIIQTCKKLVYLDISYNDGLTDVSIQRTTSLPHLKCLNIGFNSNFTDMGLATLNGNLEILDLSNSKFSSNAILMVLKRMPSLIILNLSFLEHLTMNFVRSANKIAKLRCNNIPLKIHLLDTFIDVEEIRNTCPLIKFTDDIPRGFHEYVEC